MSDRTVAVLTVAAVVAGLETAAAGTASAQDVYAYPLAGQSQERQSRDRYECHQWAVQQTGFDPMASPPPAQYQGQYQQPPQQGGSTILGLGQGGLLPGTGVLGDTATGAGLGAAGGAIAGDAGKGAAIGAIGGAVLGGLARTQQPAQPQYQPQGDPYYQQRRGQFNQAFGACMRARNYRVQ